MTTLDQLQFRVGLWQRGTFPGVNDDMRMAKLAEEFGELLADPTNAEEMADVFLVLLSQAEAHGVNLLAAAEAKFEIVRNRDQRARDAERGRG